MSSKKSENPKCRACGGVGFDSSRERQCATCDGTGLLKKSKSESKREDEQKKSEK